MQRRKHIPKRNANFLPRHLCRGFQADFVETILGLEAPDGSTEDLKFKYSYLKSEVMSKYCDTTTTPADTRRANAIAKWLKCEERNRITNERLLIDDCDFGWVTSEEIQTFAADLIAKVLGELDYDTIFDHGGHTNGASTRIRRSKYAAIQKRAGTAHVTESAVYHYINWASGSRSCKSLQLWKSSGLFTVPKKEDIDRVACKEPEINMYLQRSIGYHIRSRLRKFGIDLNDQTINQRLAKSAVSRGLATIDLSAASDSVTSQLVCNLLPPEWFVLLNDVRVHSAQVDDCTHDLQMFSSMGNGFTFELESLIFWALTRSICRFSGNKGTISVYGDDIIAPASVVPRLIRVFHWFGFRVNEKKTAYRGNFRESCGKHYHRSLDVTPFYLREPVKCKTDVIRLLNRILVWDSHDSVLEITDRTLINFHSRWTRILPTEVWGGQDPEDISSLVTGDLPRKRIVPRVTHAKRKRWHMYDQLSGFNHWLDVKRLYPEVVLGLDTRGESSFELKENTPLAVTAPWSIYLDEPDNGAPSKPSRKPRMVS